MNDSIDGDCDLRQQNLADNHLQMFRVGDLDVS